MTPVECAIVADSANDHHAGDLLTATNIASDLLGRPARVEATVTGLWLVDFTDAELAELSSEGLFERADDSRYILAELP